MYSSISNCALLSAKIYYRVSSDTWTICISYGNIIPKKQMVVFSTKVSWVNTNFVKTFSNSQSHWWSKVNISHQRDIVAARYKLLNTFTCIQLWCILDSTQYKTYFFWTRVFLISKQASASFRPCTVILTRSAPWSAILITCRLKIQWDEWKVKKRMKKIKYCTIADTK